MQWILTVKGDSKEQWEPPMVSRTHTSFPYLYGFLWEWGLVDFDDDDDDDDDGDDDGDDDDDDEEE